MKPWLNDRLVRFRKAYSPAVRTLKRLSSPSGNCECQNICSKLTGVRLEQVEHLLSRYINDIDCVLTAEKAVGAEGQISCSFRQPQSRDQYLPTTINQPIHSGEGMILTARWNEQCHDPRVYQGIPLVNLAECEIRSVLFGPHGNTLIYAWSWQTRPKMC